MKELEHLLNMRLMHMARLRNIVAAKGTIACKAGCAKCCRQKIIVDGIDGMIAYHFLNSKNLINEDFRNRLYAADYLLTSFTSNEYIKLNMPCVFLDENNKCSIYAARPIGCGSLFAFETMKKEETCGIEMLVIDYGEPSHAQAIRDVIECYKLKPCYYTLPGSVLVSEAIIKGFQLPNVASLEFDPQNPTPLSINKFDELGKK